MTAAQKQCLLACLGFYPAEEIDGEWGPKSGEATQALQKEGGIEADGIFGDETLALALERIAGGKWASAETGETDADSFWDGIRYWTREEFRCRCGGKYCNGFPEEPDRILVELVDHIRAQAGAPGHRSSGLRCQTWNAICGGVSNSRHMAGKALDFFVEGVSGEWLLAIALEDPRTRYAYIIEGQYIHVDVEYGRNTNVLEIIANHAADICAIATCAALLIKPIREWILGTEALREGQRCLLRSEIVRIYYRNRQDKNLHEYEYRNAVQCYEAYKALGGNSFIDHIYAEMQEWEITQ